MATDFVYASSASSRITEEIAAPGQPFVAEAQRIAGYDLLALTQQRSFSDVLLLLLTGELPDKPKSQLLEKLLIALCNAGPRHPATRAVMTAGVSKARAEHLLPIGLEVLGGERQGAAEVARAWQFLAHQLEHPDTALPPSPPAGFGQLYGTADPLQADLLNLLAAQAGAGAALKRCLQLQKQLAPLDAGILDTGLCAACCLDLGIGARESIGLFQLLRAPGILAHGMEQTHFPITAAPLLDDKDYDFQP